MRLITARYKTLFFSQRKVIEPLGINNTKSTTTPICNSIIKKGKPMVAGLRTTILLVMVYKEAVIYILGKV